MMPELIESVLKRNIFITLDGESRGTMYVDWFNQKDTKLNMNIITGLNREKVFEIIEKTNL